MSEENAELPENALSDVQHFVGLFAAFHEAMPDETQHIFRQVAKQIRETENVHDEEYLEGKTGIEPVWTFEKSGVIVSKRIYHPGHGERLTGADFILSKKKTQNVGVTAVQTKRNKGKSYFEFDKRDLTQLNNFSTHWRSAYYLMVDETVTSPMDCFITVGELWRLISRHHTAPPIRIPNSEVRKYCRGSNLFYDAFYGCWRGSEYTEDELKSIAFSYVKVSKRVLVELWGQKENTERIRV